MSPHVILDHSGNVDQTASGRGLSLDTTNCAFICENDWASSATLLMRSKEKDPGQPALHKAVAEMARETVHSDK